MRPGAEWRGKEWIRQRPVFAGVQMHAGMRYQSIRYAVPPSRPRVGQYSLRASCASKVRGWVSSKASRVGQYSLRASCASKVRGWVSSKASRVGQYSLRVSYVASLRTWGRARDQDSGHATTRAIPVQTWNGDACRGICQGCIFGHIRTAIRPGQSCRTGRNALFRLAIRRVLCRLPACPDLRHHLIKPSA